MEPSRSWSCGAAGERTEDRIHGCGIARAGGHADRLDPAATGLRKLPLNDAALSRRQPSCVVPCFSS
ncbi:hypothetical protein [Streptomyces sp. NPDC001410]|uniref:hypothetical protein n=1 Tax=Streptomyces sp. NPDC001410 TaxID=3364574 RepID=UPI0036B5AFA2